MLRLSSMLQGSGQSEQKNPPAEITQFLVLRWCCTPCISLPPREELTLSSLSTTDPLPLPRLLG